MKGLGMPPRMIDDKLPTDSSVIVKMLVAGEDLVDLYAIFVQDQYVLIESFLMVICQNLKKKFFLVQNMLIYQWV